MSEVPESYDDAYGCWGYLVHALEEDVKQYRQAALELNASIRDGLAWIGSGNPEFVAHNDMRCTADRWRSLLEREDA